MAVAYGQPQARQVVDVADDGYRAWQAGAVAHPVLGRLLGQCGEGFARNALYGGGAARVGWGFEAGDLYRAAYAQAALHGPCDVAWQKLKALAAGTKLAKERLAAA